jgi:hypothetical protein
MGRCYPLLSLDEERRTIFFREEPIIPRKDPLPRLGSSLTVLIKLGSFFVMSMSFVLEASNSF